MFNAILRAGRVALAAMTFSATAAVVGAFSSSELEFLDARDVLVGPDGRQRREPCTAGEIDAVQCLVRLDRAGVGATR